MAKMETEILDKLDDKMGIAEMVDKLETKVELKEEKVAKEFVCWKKNILGDHWEIHPTWADPIDC